MRAANIARWIQRHDRGLLNEPYRPDHRYDVVVFVKAMNDAHRAEARRIKSYGGKVVFDANVNYYEVWGDYDIPGTKPTVEQQRAAVELTELADHVVADSSYLLERVLQLNPQATWIPDNVDIELFHGPARRVESTLRLVWSGMARKAGALLSIVDVLGSLERTELVLVSNETPDAVGKLREAIPTRFLPFTLKDYARILRDCDVIISPKRLVNGYELGHSEWKITLGMAVGLPAVASPQRSYAEAIAYRGGGIVAATADQWRDAFARLEDAAVRADLGERARQTVAERYATPVVAAQYRDLLLQLR
jgi:glycosyltransferase involved in cell wall biosynthesis